MQISDFRLKTKKNDSTTETLRAQRMNFLFIWSGGDDQIKNITLNEQNLLICRYLPGKSKNHLLCEILSSAASVPLW